MKQTKKNKFNEIDYKEIDKEIKFLIKDENFRPELFFKMFNNDFLNYYKKVSKYGKIYLVDKYSSILPRKKSTYRKMDFILINIIKEIKNQNPNFGYIKITNMLQDDYEIFESEAVVRRFLKYV